MLFKSSSEYIHICRKINIEDVKIILNKNTIYSIKIGVNGLPRFLKSVLQHNNLSGFQGLTACIDISSWMIKGCY